MRKGSCVCNLFQISLVGNVSCWYLLWKDILNATDGVVFKKLSFVGSCSMVGVNIMIFEISLGV